jgi:tripartite-type tricarboxylate transporter receptor subunit TctC
MNREIDMLHFRKAVRVCGLAVATSLMVAMGGVAADRFPSRVITLVLPQPAGGAVDITARALALGLSNKLGQQVIVESRPGANGSLAAEFVARAEPDGYTLFMAVDSQLTVNPHLYSNLKYDPFGDFAPISVVVRPYSALIANPSLKANNIPELIALAKAHPGVINYASVGYGSLQHLGIEYFKSAAGIDLTHVPYKGASTALPDLFRGSVSLLLIGEQIAATYVNSGQVKALAVTSMRHSKLLPHVQAIADTIPGFELTAWFGVLAPKKTPESTRAALLHAIQEVVATPEFRQAMAHQGFATVGSRPDEMLAVMKSHSAHWAKLIRDIGAKIN